MSARSNAAEGFVPLSARLITQISILLLERRESHRCKSAIVAGKHIWIHCARGRFWASLSRILCLAACTLEVSSLRTYGGETARASADHRPQLERIQISCPTCNEAIGLEAFRQSVGGEVIPVIVELTDSPGVMS